MERPFTNFNFALVDGPDFREDSVREALLMPLLTALGFSESAPYRIIRSRPLTHPYVYLGTVKKGITIIPDYILERDGQYAWILDAKAPSENITSGKHVEQAYSYAIHPDIRAPLYGLCNGRKLVTFHVSQVEPVIDIPLQEVGRAWHALVGILGCRSAWPNGIAPGFSPDLGLALLKAGFDRDEDGKKVYHIVVSVELCMAAKIRDDLYSVNGHYGRRGQKFMATFDFGPEQYEAFLAKLDAHLRDNVRDALSQQPYRFFFLPPNLGVMTIVGVLGDTTYTNENETYLPFLAEQFIHETAEMWDEVDGDN